MTTVYLQEMKTKQDKQDAERAELNDRNWASTVEALAFGKKPPSEDAINRLLQLSGRSLDDLSRAVEAMAKRAGWVADMKGEPEIQAELAKATAELAAEREKFETANRAFMEKQRDYNNAASRLQTKLGMAQEARRLLIQSCARPDVAKRFQQALDKLTGIQQRLDRQRQELGVAPHTSTGLTFTISQLENCKLPANPGNGVLKEQIRQAKLLVPIYQERIDRLEAELAAADAELKAAEIEILKP